MGETGIQLFSKGMRDGFPIGIGYLAVSMAVGIAANQGGLDYLQATVMSALCIASAGEYAGIKAIAEQMTYWEIALITVVINARYFLMSASLSQKIQPKTPLWQRLLVGQFITDELFGANMAVQGFVNPLYSFGLIAGSVIFWVLGTFLGAVMGQVLPNLIVTALGVLLYGMFIAIIIPAGKSNHRLLLIEGLTMAIGFVATKLPILATMSSGLRIAILIVGIAGVAALVCPVTVREEEEHINE